MRNLNSFVRAGLALLLPLGLLSGCGGGATTSPVISPSPTAIGTSLPVATAIPGTTSTPQPTPHATTISGARVACVGDSITYGYGVENRETKAYPVLLGRWLGTGSTVVNYGVGRTTALDTGAYSYQQQTAFIRALAFKPNVLVVALGTNDSRYAFTDTTKIAFETDYQTLISTFRGVNPSIKVYLCLPVPSYPVSRRENITLSTSILPLIRQVAQDSGATVIDLNTALSNHAELFPDGVHPNAEGARIIAQTVYASLTGRTAPS